MMKQDSKKCFFYDRGFCNYKTKCYFLHPVETCGAKACNKNNVPKDIQKFACTF